MDFLFFFFLLSARASHAADSIPPHALFKWRGRGAGVAGDELPPSHSMRRRLVVLPVRRVYHSDVRGSVFGRLKPLQAFLSLLHVKVQESPPVCMMFHLGPWSFNFIYAPYFDYWSFDLVQLGPWIEIKLMYKFQLDPPSFNFFIGLK